MIFLRNSTEYEGDGGTQLNNNCEHLIRIVEVMYQVYNKMCYSIEVLQLLNKNLHILN